MHFKIILKSFVLLCSFLVANAAVDCSNPDKIDTDACRADILIITTDQTSDGFKSVRNTLDKLKISTNQLIIPKEGVADDRFLYFLYENPTTLEGARYSAIVFPNGRVSYDNGKINEPSWESAIKPNQWDIFNNYSAKTQSRIVFLNEYPSNYTGTKLLYDNPVYYRSLQNYSFDENADLFVSSKEDNLNTEEIWHYQAKLLSDRDLKKSGFSNVEPLLYFEPSENVPEKSVAAVDGYYNDARFLAFYTGFGEWSSVSNKLNVFWITWFFGDISHISDAHITSEEAFSASPKSAKLALGSIVLSTIFVIMATLI